VTLVCWDSQSSIEAEANRSQGGQQPIMRIRARGGSSSPPLCWCERYALWGCWKTEAVLRVRLDGCPGNTRVTYASHNTVPAEAPLSSNRDSQSKKVPISSSEDVSTVLNAPGSLMCELLRGSTCSAAALAAQFEACEESWCYCLAGAFLRVTEDIDLFGRT